MKVALTEVMLEELLTKGEDFTIEVCYDMNELKGHLKILGWESEEDYDTNGYQVDWWETWKKDDKVLNLSGSFWYSFLNGEFI